MDDFGNWSQGQIREQVFKCLTSLANVAGRVSALEERQTKKETKGLRSLKNRLGRLTTDVRILESLALQDQIGRLNNRIRVLEKELMETGRELASREICDLRDRIEDIISGKPVPSYQKMHDFLVSESLLALELVRVKDNPIAIYVDFRNRCETFFNDDDYPLDG